jgi:hypothetical protein
MKFQILTLVISVIYVFLAYYGYMRFMKLKYRSCEDYARDYLKLPRVNVKNKVIVSMATTVNDLNDIKSTINSILDQTVHADQIIISIPGSKELMLPNFIKDHKIILVHNVSKQFDKSSSFLSPLLREKDGEAIIVVVDDKVVYGSDFLETLIEASIAHPNNVIFIKGYKASNLISDNKKIDVPYINDIISVADGVLIKPKFFDIDILSFEHTPAGLETNPDILLSAYLHKQKVQITQIKYDENFRKREQILPNSDKFISYYASIFPSFL